MPMFKSSIRNCRIIELPKISDSRGSLTFVEGKRHFPFDIKRVYYLYDVPGGAERGGHAHKTVFEMVVAMSGSFDVTIDDGKKKKTIHMNRSYNGLLLHPHVWRKLDNFSSGAVCLVLASDYYDEADYIRRYRSFLAAAKKS